MTKEQIKTLDDEIARVEENRDWDAVYYRNGYLDGLYKAKEILGLG